MPRKVSAGAQAAREGTLDMLSARSSAVRARLGNDDNVSIDYIEACGDCFYLAIESALSEICGWQPYYAVATQRQLVASQMNEETFQLYELLYAQQAEGFGFMKGVESLDQLRRRVLLRGKQVGAHRCVWADGLAMEVVANHFGVLLLIMDERCSESQRFTRIAPRRIGGGGADVDNGAMDASQSTVLLHASSREHMNLVMYGGKKLPQLGDIPPSVTKLWGVTLAPPGACAAGSHPDGSAPHAHVDFQRFLADGVATGAIRPRPGLGPPRDLVVVGVAGSSGGNASAAKSAPKRGGGGSARGGGAAAAPNGRSSGKRPVVTEAPVEAAPVAGWSETAWPRSLRPRGSSK